jgi:hypothetical protein
MTGKRYEKDEIKSHLNALANFKKLWWVLLSFRLPLTSYYKHGKINTSQANEAQKSEMVA